MRTFRTLFLLLLLLTTAFAPAQTKRYLYVFKAPKDRTGFRTQTPSIEVHDIDDNHKIIKVIPIPDNAPFKIENIRGVSISAESKRMFISHYGCFKCHDTGYVLCMDLVSNKILWHKKYESAVDRGDNTPDGSKLFMPSGENVDSPYFYVIDGATGEEKASDRISFSGCTHNTIVSLDGSKVFMSAFGTAFKYGNSMHKDWKYLMVADTKTNQIIQKIGPTMSSVRPFTINGKATIAYMNIDSLLGFVVGDVKTGKILYTATPPAAHFSQPLKPQVVSHGIGLTANEKYVWVVDQMRSGMHIFDVRGVPQSAPVWVKYINTNTGKEKDKNGNYSYGEEGITGQPGWITSTIDGKYIYAESGEIFDTDKIEKIGQLIDPNGHYQQSRFMFEVDFDGGGQPIAAGNQFAIGRIR